MNTPLILPAAIIKDGQADWGYIRVVLTPNQNVARVELKVMPRENMPTEWQPFVSIMIVEGRVAFHIHELMKGTLNAATGTVTPQGAEDERAPEHIRDASRLRSAEVGEDPPGIVGRPAPRPE